MVLTEELCYGLTEDLCSGHLNLFLRYAIQQNWNIMVYLEIANKSRLPMIYMPYSGKRDIVANSDELTVSEIFLMIHKS